MKERGNHFLRFADRYFGIPLIFFLSIFKKKRICPQHPKKIALLKTAGIGDITLLSAIISTLKEYSFDITLFTGYSNAAVGRLIPGISIVPLPMTNPYASLKIIRQHNFDVWLDFDPWPRINAFFSFFSKSKWTAGFKTKGQARHFLYDASISHTFSKHELENYRTLLSALGIRSSSLPYIPIPSREQKKCVALHLFPGGSRAYLKLWPKKQWMQLIEILTSWNYNIILTGSKQDRELLNEYILGSNITNVSGISLEETAHLLKSCKAVVSVDTGIMHLAAALDCSVIGLHGPTSPNRWGAIGKNVHSVIPQINYTPCIQLGFESKCKKCTCMSSISVGQVVRLLEEILCPK